jgi:hypothetical protein
MKSSPFPSRSIRRVALVAVALLATACQRGSEIEDLNPEPEPEPVVLIVRNHGYYDVDIFTLRSGSSRGLREGTVPGNGTQQLTIQPHDLQPGGVLVVQVHAIGTNSTWTSRAISIPSGGAAQLDIQMDPGGGMWQSVLVPLLEPPGG